MDFLHDFALGALMLFVAFICYDWAHKWYRQRRFGNWASSATIDGPIWLNSYLGYKVWTWFVRVLAWLIALWHVCLAVLWFVELAFAFAVSVS